MISVNGSLDIFVYSLFTLIKLNGNSSKLLPCQCYWIVAPLGRRRNGWRKKLEGNNTRTLCAIFNISWRHHHHHHHHVTLLAQIYLTLSRHASLSSIAPGGVFQATSCIGIELLYIGSNWSSNLCSSMWRGLLEYIAYEFVLTFPAVSSMSGSSNFDSFCDGWVVGGRTAAVLWDVASRTCSI